MKIDLCFSGWVKGYEVNHVYDTILDKTLTIPKTMTDEEIIEKLNNGEWLISLDKALMSSEEISIEIFDYQPSIQEIQARNTLKFPGEENAKAKS